MLNRTVQSQAMIENRKKRFRTMMTPELYRRLISPNAKSSSVSKRRIPKMLNLRRVSRSQLLPSEESAIREQDIDRSLFSNDNNMYPYKDQENQMDTEGDKSPSTNKVPTQPPETPIFSAIPSNMNTAVIITPIEVTTDDSWREYLEKKTNSGVKWSDLVGVPVPSVLIELATDANNSAIGATIFQRVEGRIRYLRFHSRILSKSELNYSVPKKELLSVIVHMNYYRHLQVKEYQVSAVNSVSGNIQIIHLFND